MQPLLATSACLALCVPALGQTWLTTPPGGLAEDGADFRDVLGASANARYQFVDGLHRGQARSIQEIAFRLDTHAYKAKSAFNETNGTGRTWSKIRLEMSETSMDDMSAVWAANILDTPSVVFDGSWTWPTQSGWPLLKPDVWGGRTGALRFPFRTPWVYSGHADILADYRFRGGTLANNAPWGEQWIPYWLDGEWVNTSSNGVESHPLSWEPRCKDSAFPATQYPWGAHAKVVVGVYGPHAETPEWRNKVWISWSTTSTAPNAPVMHAFALRGNVFGVDAGAHCNHLHLDPSSPIWLFPSRTIHDGSAESWVWVPWNREMTERQLWMQGAWTESRTGMFSLTGAAYLSVPPPPLEPSRVRLVFATNLIEPAGLGPLHGSYFPYVRYLTR